MNATSPWATIRSGLYNVVLLASTVLIVVAVGCGASRTNRVSDPADALAAFTRAIRDKRLKVAYDMMSAKFRERHDVATFTRLLRENAREVERSLARLSAKSRPMVMQAVVRLDGDEIRLVAENGQWRIANDPIDFYSQQTPQAALRSFVRAIGRRRYDIVLRFVPAKWAHAMTRDKLRRQWEGDKRDEVEQLLKNLRANLDSPIQVDGDRAVMPYAENYEVKFVREDGLWKIEDPD